MHPTPKKVVHCIELGIVCQRKGTQQGAFLRWLRRWDSTSVARWVSSVSNDCISFATERSSQSKEPKERVYRATQRNYATREGVG